MFDKTLITFSYKPVLQWAGHTPRLFAAMHSMAFLRCFARTLSLCLLIVFSARSLRFLCLAVSWVFGNRPSSAYIRSRSSLSSATWLDEQPIWLKCGIVSRIWLVCPWELLLLRQVRGHGISKYRNQPSFVDTLLNWAQTWKDTMCQSTPIWPTLTNGSEYDPSASKWKRSRKGDYPNSCSNPRCRQGPQSGPIHPRSKSIACLPRTSSSSHHASSLYRLASVAFPKLLIAATYSWGHGQCTCLISFRIRRENVHQLTRRGIHWRNLDRVCEC